MAIIQNTKQILWIPSAHTDPGNNFKRNFQGSWLSRSARDGQHPFLPMEDAATFWRSAKRWVSTSIELVDSDSHWPNRCGNCLPFLPAAVPLAAGAICPVSPKEYPHLAGVPVHPPDFHAKPTLNWSFKLRHWVLQFILVCSSELLTCKLQETVLPKFYEKYINIFLGCKLLNWYLISTEVATKDGRESDIK